MRILLTCLLLLLAEPAIAQAPGSADFDAGVAAYRQGDTAAALRRFERARALGYDSPQLRFNLGLAYYRLGRLPEARVQFEALRRDRGYEAIAEFHLALVAAKAGDRQQAAERWRGVAAGPDAALAQRARVALARLESGRRPARASGYVLAGAGYDSNPMLVDEGLQPGGATGSAGLELLGLATLPLSGTERAYTAVQGGVYLHDYFRDVGADQRGLFAALSRERDAGDGHLAYGLEASASDYDGDAFQRIVGVQVLRRPGPGGGWRVGAQASHIFAPAPYGYLEGWRARAALAREFRMDVTGIRLGYDLEYNDREDLATGAEFFSSSPLRQRLEAVAEHPVVGGTLRGQLRYRDSRYRDADVFMDGVVLREQRRTERQWLAAAQWRRRLSRETFLLAELQYTRNTATPDAYDYDRNVVLLGLEWAPVGK